MNNTIHVIDYFVVLIVIDVFFLLLDIFTSLDLESDISWPYEFKWLFVGMTIVGSLMLFYKWRVFVWKERLVSYGMFHSKRDHRTDNKYKHVYDAQGIGYSTTLVRMPDAYYESTTVKSASTNVDFVVYLLKPKYERQMTYRPILQTPAASPESQEIYNQMKIDLDTPPDYINPLTMVDDGGLTWGFIFFGIVVFFVTMLLVYLENHMDWLYMIVPYTLVCIYPWVLLYCQYPLATIHWSPAVWEDHYYHRLAIPWIIDVVRNQTRYGDRYKITLIGIVCIDISFMMSYFVILYEIYEWGWYIVFLIPICYFGFLSCISASFIVQRCTNPLNNSKNITWFSITFAYMIFSTLTASIVLVWIRLQWASYEWAWSLVPFAVCCLVIILGIIIVIKQDDTPRNIIKEITIDKIMLTTDFASLFTGTNKLTEDTNNSSILPNKVAYT